MPNTQELVITERTSLEGKKDIRIVERTPKGNESDMRVLHATDKRSGLNAMIALHSSSLTPPHFGGCRMLPYADNESMQHDVESLARLMTNKNALVGLPFRGSKCALMGDPKKDKTPERLRAMGTFIHSLQGLIRTGGDTNIGPNDVEIIGEIAPESIVGLKSPNPAIATGIGVAHGLIKAVQTLYETEPKNLRLLIYGVGQVGQYALPELVKTSWDITITDKNEKTLETQYAHYKERVKKISCEKIWENSWDVVCLNVSGSTLEGGALTIPQLDALHRAKKSEYVIIGGGTNVMFNEHEYEKIENYANSLKGIIVIPSYVINAGGVYSVAREITQATQEQVHHVAKEIIPNTIANLINEWKVSKIPLTLLAEKQAKKILESKKS